MARGIGRWVIGALGVAALVLAFKLLPLDTWLLGLVERIRGTGMAGSVLYVLVYGVATVLVMPASVLTMGAGFAWGPVYGTPRVVVASNLGALAAFLLGRTALRERVARRLASRPRFSAVDAAVAARGFRVVLLLRLSPIFPFNLLNYALALTRVSTRDYVLASFLGMLPTTVLYVYLGSLVTSVAQLTRGQRPNAGPYGQLLLWAGLAATVLVTVSLTRIARRALDATLRQCAPPSSQEPLP